MVTEILILLGLALFCLFGYSSAMRLNTAYRAEKGENSMFWLFIAGMNFLCVVINCIKALYLLV
jgi:hypothetical protein